MESGGNQKYILLSTVYSTQPMVIAKYKHNKVYCTAKYTHYKVYCTAKYTYNKVYCTAKYAHYKVLYTQPMAIAKPVYLKSNYIYIYTYIYTIYSDTKRQEEFILIAPSYTSETQQHI